MSYYKKESSNTSFSGWINPPAIIEDLTLQHVEKSVTQNGSMFLKIQMFKRDNPDLKLPWLAEYEILLDESSKENKERSQKRINEMIDRGLDLLRCYYSAEEYEEHLDKAQNFEDYCNIMVWLLQEKINDGTAALTPLRGKIVSDSKGWAAWARWNWIQKEDNPNPLKISDSDKAYAAAKIAARREAYVPQN